MATINIGAANAGDEFYRYKMPKLVAKIEGRGNGIKTNVVNNVDIAKALERPPEYVLKYYGCELGAQTNYDKTTGTSIVNGAHDAKKLSEILEGFIKKFVQCYSCRNPETTIKIKKDFIQLKCKACGFVSDVDPRHKLNTFILKNPPENKMSKEEKKLKKAEEERLREAGEQDKKDKEKKEKKDKEKDKDKDKEKKEKKKDKKDKKKDDKGDEKDDKEVEEEEQESEDDDGVVWMTDTSAEAAKRRAEEQLTAATAAMVTQGNIEAEEEAARKKAEREAKKKAQDEEDERRRKAEEEARLAEETAKKLALEAASPVDALRAAIADGTSPADMAARVKSLSVPGGLAGKVRVLYEAVFLDPALSKATKLADVLKQRKPLFAALSRDGPGQLAQVIAVEHLMTVTMVDRIKEGPLILKALFDENLVSDEVMLAWADKLDAGRILEVPADGAKLLRSSAQPLIDWLREEEDDDDDDEEDEDEEEDDE